MRRSYDVLFASSNADKHREASAVLGRMGVRAGRLDCELEEIQSDSLAEIASHKAADALARCGEPVIVEDTGLFIDALRGFPGPYSAHAYETIGTDGILRLVSGLRRDASFCTVVAYAEPQGGTPETFEARVRGHIPAEARGGGWGYDPVFVPHSAEGTYGEISNKDELSHRALALERFARWFARRRG